MTSANALRYVATEAQGTAHAANLVSYPGSKAAAGTWQRIIGQMPPHDFYVEPFAGSAQVFRRKLPARRSLLIEKDTAAVAALGVTAGARIVCCDCFDWLESDEATDLIWSDRALLYCDPPYPLTTRAGRRYYAHEFEDAQHARLLELLDQVKAYVLISTYPNALYSSRLRGWRCLEYDAITRGGRRREQLWCNFPEPEVLHDWRYAGFNRRERFNLKRFIARWVARIEAMPPRKRGYVLHELENSIVQMRRLATDQRTTSQRGHSAWTKLQV